MTSLLSKENTDNLISAPMAGFTNSPLRKTFAENGAYRIFSEMVHVREILNLNLWEIPIFLENYNYTIQLFGSIDDDFIEAISKILDFADNFDINCGCPVKKVIKAKGGAFWLKDIDKLIKKVDQISRKFKGKVSIKIRVGFDKPELLDLISNLNDTEVEYITIHMRTATMLFKGEPLYELYEQVSHFPKPMIVNGNITSPMIAKKLFEKYKPSGLMIGRAAIENPAIFKEISFYLKEGRLCTENKLNKIDFLISYFENMLDYVNSYPFFNLIPEPLKEKALSKYDNSKNEADRKKFLKKTIVESRKIAFNIIKGYPEAYLIKQNILSLENLEDVKNFIQQTKIESHKSKVRK
ncbi:MAG TPA: tRNA-dihydrouridine synthase family protein [Exilispira sp.]|nr:tRNA-dihydrouridine synthase family protein [Spirochaetota bacterium]HOV46238.1 tRNA-dihydrouridine synthase family protein [Exilispira sp.]